MPRLGAASTAFFIALMLAVAPVARAQGVLEEVGPSAPGQIPFYVGPGQVMGTGGSPTIGAAPPNSLFPGTLPSGIAVVNPGQGFAAYSGYANAPYSEFKWGFDNADNGLLTLDRIGGGPAPSLGLSLNGIPYPLFPVPGGGNAPMPTSPTVPAGDMVLGNGGATLRDGGPGYVSVRDTAYAGGAKGDGTTVDTASINAAIVAANALPSGGTVLFPAGTYYIRADLAVIHELSHVTLRGAGKGRTIIDCDDTLGALGPVGCIMEPSAGALDDFELRDITISGRVQTSPIGSSMPLVSLQFVKSGPTFPCTNIRIIDSEIINARYFGLVAKGCDGFVATGNHIAFTTRDGLDCWGCTHVLMANNRLEYTNDDGLSCHEDPIEGFNSTNPLPSGCTISDNLLMESNISSGGAKNLTISGNQINRARANGIVVMPGGSPGGTSTFAVNITGNTITDVYGEPGPQGCTTAGCRYTQNFWYMLIGGGPKQVLVPSFGAAGTIGLLYNQNTSGANNSPGGGYFNVTNNIMKRTLAANSTNYSDWGYDTRGAWRCTYTGRGNPATDGITCGWNNSPITEALLRTPGLVIGQPLRNSHITNNIIDTSASSIVVNELIGGVTAASNDFDGLLIKGNTLSDCPDTLGCLYFPAAGYQNAVFEDNLFDGDPRFVSTSRGSNGTWLLTGLPTYCLNLNGTASGVSVINNKFKNCDVSLQAPLAPMGLIQGNQVYDNPVAVGYNAGNVGVAIVPFDGLDFTNIHWDGNPNSATYGQVLTAPVLAAPAMPTSGTFVQGHVVANNAPDPLNFPVYSWVRETTGSGNVLGTDWFPVLISGAPGLVAFSTPGNPAGTASGAYLMAGLAQPFTVRATGNIHADISGICANSTGGDGGLIAVAWGTGTAPVNGAAASGTVVGNGTASTSSTNNAPQSCSLMADIATALAPGTAIWVDLQQKAAGGGIFSVSGLTVRLQEY